MTTPSIHITFVAHGSKKEEANDFLRNLITGAASGSPQVNLGFLELASPSIPEALESHVRKGAKTIRVIPLFLVPGRHMTEDIPAQIKAVEARNPSIQITLDEFIGNTPAFKKILCELICID